MSNDQMTKGWVCLVVAFCVSAFALADDAKETIRPEKRTALFNGKDLSGLTTWLKDTEREDPRGVFRVTDGMLHLSGDGDGYLATEREYRDYRLVVEYKWGQRHAGKFVRNSGILLHATGPDGNAGAWPSSFECQLAQGCVGDLILIQGKDEQGRVIPMTFTAEIERSPDGRRRRWKRGGEKATWPPERGQLWWSRHQWDFEELLDTRGEHDVESPVGEWTRVECLCDGDEITIVVNGHTVNHVSGVSPSAGKILLQTEGSEIFFRTFEIYPLDK
jgi:hypothetical protein